MQTKITEQCQVAEVILVQPVLSSVSGFVIIVRDIFTALGIVSNNNLCTVSESVFTVPCLSVA